MIRSTLTFSPSFERLAKLRLAASPHCILPSLDEPPVSGTDPSPYFDKAIAILGESAVHLHEQARYSDSRYDKIDDLNTAIVKLDGNTEKYNRYVNKRVDRLEGDLGTVKRDVKIVKDDVKAFRVDVNQRFDDVNRRFDDVNRRFDEIDQRFDTLQAMLFNRLARFLHTRIQKVGVLIQGRNGHKSYESSRDFPTTVKQFWLLQGNSKHIEVIPPLIKLTAFIVTKLTSLARYYSVEGWEDWKSLDEEETGQTQYNNLEDAVAAHPMLCLRALAEKWYLEYGQLQKLDDDTEEFHVTKRKRKADDDTNIRRIKVKRGNDYEAEISILSSTSDEVVLQSTITRSGPKLRVPRQATLEEILNKSERSRNSLESAGIGWETSSSVRAARHRLRAQIGMDPPVPNDPAIGEKRREPRAGVVMDIRSKASEEEGQERGGQEDT